MSADERNAGYAAVDASANAIANADAAERVGWRAGGN